jgi:hypothetical protein
MIDISDLEEVYSYWIETYEDRDASYQVVREGFENLFETLGMILSQGIKQPSSFDETEWNPNELKENEDFAHDNDYSPYEY